MNPAKGKNKTTVTKKKAAGKKNTGSKKVREEKDLGVKRAVNSVLIAILVFVILAASFEFWIFLGKPGWPGSQREDRSVCLELYFKDSSVMYFVPVHRRVTLAPEDSLTSRAVEEFALGPRDPLLARIYPSNIPVPAVTINGDIATVDLPREIRAHFGGTARESALVDGLTLTVAAAGECSKTMILIEGQVQETTPEGIMLNEPLEPPEFFNIVPDSWMSAEPVWVAAYFLDETGKYIIPLAVETDDSRSPAENAVHALLVGPPGRGVNGPQAICPGGYELTRLLIENGIATVEINVPNPQNAFINQDINIFRRALYLTLKKCCGINDIALRLNGRDLESYARFAGLTDVTDESCWNVEIFNESYTGSGPTAGPENRV